MKIFLRLFKAEFIKTNKTYGFLISVLIPIFIAILQFFIFYIKHEHFAKYGINPWKVMGMNLFSILGIIVMPMYIVLITYLINFTEHQSNSWKYLFALPISKIKIYTVKISMTLFWVLVFCISIIIFMYLSGFLLSLFRPDIGFQDYNINYIIFLSIFKLFLSSFGIISIQFLFSIYWKDFIRPVGIGLTLTIAAFILSSWEYIYVLPYAHPYSIMGNYNEFNTRIFTTPIMFSLVYGIIFFIAGFNLILKKEIK